MVDRLVEEKVVKFLLFLLQHMMPGYLPSHTHLLMIPYQNNMNQFLKREKEVPSPSPSRIVVPCSTTECSS
jgi:hypothetical protein